MLLPSPPFAVVHSGKSEHDAATGEVQHPDEPCSRIDSMQVEWRRKAICGSRHCRWLGTCHAAPQVSLPSWAVHGCGSGTKEPPDVLSHQDGSLGETKGNHRRLTYHCYRARHPATSKTASRSVVITSSSSDSPMTSGGASITMSSRKRVNNPRSRQTLIILDPV